MERQLALRRERLANGHRSIGWKLGFGAPAALQRLRLDAPLVGFLTDRVLLPSDPNVAIRTWTKPMLEPEIAVYMGSDLTGPPDRDKTKAAIAAVGPAFELADLDVPPDDVEAILACNIYNRHVILGPQDTSRAGCVLDGLAGSVLDNNQQLLLVANPQALTGDLVDVVGHLAFTLSQFGETLRENEVIITGSITPPIFLKPGDTVRYTLNPIATVAVRTN